MIFKPHFFFFFTIKKKKIKCDIAEMSHKISVNKQPAANTFAYIFVSARDSNPHGNFVCRVSRILSVGICSAVS